MLASVTAAGNSASYRAVMTPVTDIASGWYFSTRKVHLPVKVGAATPRTGTVTLAATLALAFVLDGHWAAAGPWLVLRAGLGIFALAWNSVATTVVAVASLMSTTLVAPTEPATGYVILTLSVGMAAAIAVFVELVRGGTPRA